MAALHLTHFTDPGCPFAYSAEPHRLRLLWRYGDAIAWTTKAVGLSEVADDNAKRGFTPEMQAAGAQRLSAEYGMPMSTEVRSHVSGTVPACRAFVAVRENEPQRADAMLRALRLRNFGGGQLDDLATRHGAAIDAGIDPADLDRWSAEEATERALRADMHDARHPTPEALAQDARLAGWDGGRRYTCPSYEIETTDGRHLSVPGFQPFQSYELAFGNLAPTLEQRATPETVAEVLDWAPYALTTQEVAALREVDREAARGELEAAGATFTPVGNDGVWTA
jgi:predicted DsbA family dithiol-disulfide isomerase